MKDLKAGQLSELAPGVRRLVAPNPGMMTGPGTNTYLLGKDSVTVIDPGPAIDEHVHAIQAAAPGTIDYILVTHTHVDHSPAARALADATGAQLVGRPAPESAGQDATFQPHRVLKDGDLFETADVTLQAVHTPGHASNHLCYWNPRTSWLFTGDHVMNGSTVVINPPDGNMQHYLDSLQRLKTLELITFAPGHGALMSSPYTVIDWIIEHRLEREAKVIAAMSQHPGSSVVQLVPWVYQDVPPQIHSVATRSLLAHLLKLENDGRVVRVESAWYLV